MNPVVDSVRRHSSEVWTLSSKIVGACPILPRSPAHLALLLAFYEVEKVVYEVGYELDNRPDWVEIPLRGLTRIVRALENEGPPGASAEPVA